MGEYHENAKEYWMNVEAEDNVQSGRVEMVTVKTEDGSEVYVEEVPIDSFTITGDGELVIDLDFDLE